MSKQEKELQADAPHVIAVIGAGPTGLYAAQKLAKSGYHVVLINRDIKPGGLAEYGIYPAKHKMKEGLRKQFRRILALPEVSYFGNVHLGRDGDLSLDDLSALPFSAVLFAIGAQGTRTLGLPGEENTSGIFHAKDLVYHFNQLPPFASQSFEIGQRVGIIGMGNVMVDIARWLICEKHVEEVVTIGRRGPNERAYTDKEMREIIEVMDQKAVTEELERITPYLEAVGQDADATLEELNKPLEKAIATQSPSKFRFKFLCTSKKILSENGRVCGLEVEHNELVPKGESLRPKGTGETSVIELDTLIYAIGDQVDENVGLPYEWGKYIVCPEPHPTHPERPRYEVFDPQKESTIPGQFVGGWARSASDGLVGKARSDGETAVEEIIAYLAAQTPASSSEDAVALLTDLLHKREVVYTTQHDVEYLEQAEKQKAEELKRDFFKFDTNEEMLEVIQSSQS